jgi:hypothetical protein
MANFLLHSHYGSRLIMTKIFFQFFGGVPCVWAIRMFAGSSDQPRENGFSMRKRSRSCRHRERIAFWNACSSFREKNCASIPCTDLQRSSRSERTSNALREKTPHSLTCRNCPPGRAKPTFFPSASSASVPCACKSPHATIGFTGVRQISHCPWHLVRLLEKCPSCGAPIAANRLSPRACSGCQNGDYRTADVVPLSPENPLYLGERLLLKAFGFELPANENASRSLAGSPLPTLSGVFYLYLLKTVTSRLDTIFSQRELVLLMHLLRAFSPEDSPPLTDLFEEKSVVVFFLFHWLFLAWPTHFRAFLDAWYSLSTPPFTGKHPESVLSASRSLFFDQFESSAYAWLRRVYRDYHRQFRQDPDRIDHFHNATNLLARSIHPQQ